MCSLICKLLCECLKDALRHEMCLVQGSSSMGCILKFIKKKIIKILHRKIYNGNIFFSIQSVSTKSLKKIISTFKKNLEKI